MNLMRRRRLHQIQHKRAENGLYMIELLISIAISAMLAAALVDSMAETSRLASSGQNQILATAIVQEQIDNARNLTYTQLSNMAGTYTPMLVNRTAPGQVGPAPNPRPLLLDLNANNFNWAAPAGSNLFGGTVSETIQAGPYANTMQVTVTANWVEGTQNRTYSLSTLISQDGIHNE